MPLGESVNVSEDKLLKLVDAYRAKNPWAEFNFEVKENPESLRIETLSRIAVTANIPKGVAPDYAGIQADLLAIVEAARV